jgi:hypothetical protein
MVAYDIIDINSSCEFFESNDLRYSLAEENNLQENI